MSIDGEWIEWLPELDTSVARDRGPLSVEGHYRYSRIDNASDKIRLVQVMPPVEGYGVRCRLVVHDRKTAPPYTALSYT